MKASRFLEELPGDPALYERWQLEDGPALPALPAPGPGALVMPPLFTSGTEGKGGGGKDDVPF
jgi:hypothetical protein